MNVQPKFSGQDPKDFGIETTDINTAQGVSLSSQQKLLTGCVLDLFKGRPTLKKLQLWDDDATFNDPLTISKGRKQYQAQWYGLKAIFSEIEQLESIVKSSGNPIELDVKTRYKFKIISKEKIISSKVKIFLNPSENLITGVDDLWNGDIPQGTFAKVGISQIVNPFWLLGCVEVLGFWIFSLFWWTRLWEILRKLNSVIVPAIVSVPNSIAYEDTKKAN